MATSTPRWCSRAWVRPEFDADNHHVNLLDDTQLVVVTRGSPEHLDLAEARTGRVRTEYMAAGKETLAEVAKKFGMGSHDLARINRISHDTVLANGQTIIVYQVADPNRSKRADEQWQKTPRARRGKVSGAPTERTTSAPKREPDAERDDSTVPPAKPPDHKPTPDEKPARLPVPGPVTKPAQAQTSRGLRSACRAHAIRLELRHGPAYTGVMHFASIMVVLAACGHAPSVAGDSGGTDGADGADATSDACNANGATTSGTQAELTGVWTLPSCETWAVASDGTVLHWDGTAWSVSTKVANGLDAIWGSAPGDVWATGFGSTTLHWDGHVWIAVPNLAGTIIEYWAIHGTAANDVWAAGEAGTVIHWDGVAWSLSTAHRTALYDLDGVLARSIDDVWVVSDGELGAIERWDGHVWTMQAPPAGLDVHTGITAIWGPTSDDVWIATTAGPLVHWDGAAWTSNTPLPLPNSRVLSFAGLGSDDIWAVGTIGTMLHWDGTVWTAHDSGTATTLTAVAASPQAVWAVGGAGTIVRR